MAKKFKGVSAEPSNEADDLNCENEKGVLIACDGSVDERLWYLYVARVGQADLIHTVRRDARVIFREAFDEAKVALGVFLDECSKSMEA